MSLFRSKHLFVINLILLISVVQSVVVVTRKGPIKGYENNGYNTFFGIPYAKVDENNPFGSSLGYPNFETPFDAKDSSILCPQVFFNDNGILECLRLNIYVPKTASATNLRPILVWFHGGGFAFGSAGEYEGEHLVKHDVIVVTVNYRLGPYGFLCLDDPSVPGNQGVKDQIAALKWLHENIVAFGGDASKITIAGESYGGGGVDLHLYSKFATLFDKAIIQSGSVFAEGFYVKPDYNAAIKLSKHLGFNVNTNRNALQVLAKVNPIDVMAATRNISLQLCVCKEKTFKDVANFVINDPFHLNNLERIKNKPIMIGYTSQELLYMFVNKPQEFYNETSNIFYNELKKNFNFKESKLIEVSEIIKTFYLGNKSIGPETMLNLSNFMSDFAVNHAVERSVNKYITQEAKVYKYLFSYIGGSEHRNVTGAGAMHTEELKYLFEWNSQLKGHEQNLIRDRMTTLWTNFVKFGNPTPEITKLLPVSWTPIDGRRRQYFNIDVEMTVGDHIFPHRMTMWDDFWRKYEKNSIIYDNGDTKNVN